MKTYYLLFQLELLNINNMKITILSMQENFYQSIGVAEILMIRYMNINKKLIISRSTEETTSHQWSMAAYNARYQLGPSNPITVFYFVRPS